MASSALKYARPNRTRYEAGPAAPVTVAPVNSLPRAATAKVGDFVYVGGQLTRVSSVKFYRADEVPAKAPVREGSAARRVRTPLGSLWFGLAPVPTTAA